MQWEDNQTLLSTEHHLRNCEEASREKGMAIRRTQNVTLPSNATLTTLAKCVGFPELVSTDAKWEIKQSFLPVLKFHKSPRTTPFTYKKTFSNTLVFHQIASFLRNISLSLTRTRVNVKGVIMGRNHLAPWEFSGSNKITIKWICSVWTMVHRCEGAIYQLKMQSKRSMF